MNRSQPQLFLAVTAFIAVFGLACEPDVETWHGEHLDYEWETSLEPCDGLPERLDAFIPFVAEQLGMEVDDFATITYTWLTYESYADLPSLTENAGKATRGQTWSFYTGSLHELVHTVVFERRFLGLPFLAEGLAVAFEAGDFPVFFYAEAWGPRARFDRVDPRPFLDHHYARDNLDFYGPAGGFVAYLLSRHGSEKLLRLHERLKYTSSAERFHREFAEIYSLNLEDEVAHYLDDDECPEDATVVPQPYACAGLTSEWSTPERWADTRSMRCVEGESSAYHVSPIVAVTVEIPEAGDYVVELFGDPDSAALLVPCGRCPWLAKDSYLRPGARVLPLDAGLHAIIYSGSAVSTRWIGSTILRVEEP